MASNKELQAELDLALARIAELEAALATTQAIATFHGALILGGAARPGEDAKPVNCGRAILITTDRRVSGSNDKRAVQYAGSFQHMGQELHVHVTASGVSWGVDRCAEEITPYLPEALLEELKAQNAAAAAKAALAKNAAAVKAGIEKLKASGLTAEQILAQLLG